MPNTAPEATSVGRYSLFASILFRFIRFSSDVPQLEALGIAAEPHCSISVMTNDQPFSEAEFRSLMVWMFGDRDCCADWICFAVFRSQVHFVSGIGCRPSDLKAVRVRPVAI